MKSTAVVPGILGGQFDAEFRGRNPQEKGQLLDKMKDRPDGVRGHLGQQPDARVQHHAQALRRRAGCARRCRMAIDRWGGSEALSKISVLKFVGGVMRPGLSDVSARSRARQAPRASRRTSTSRARTPRSCSKRLASRTSSSSCSTATSPSPIRRAVYGAAMAAKLATSYVNE